ncbi:transmembrane protein [Anaeramoeba flamelloides]|uniref:Transmembrane protein n=1 Tax=Anaeramoeba flamelloides TaxID=1746091 RepID=A0AAV7YEH8_9EUKA|nr:transmembrane protein [Anaeramoeba flamelloides]
MERVNNKPKFAIDNWSNKKTVVLIIVFICSLSLSVIIGLCGPSSTIQKDLEFPIKPDTEGIKYRVSIKFLSHLNKELQISTTFGNKNDYAVNAKLDIETQLFGNFSRKKLDVYTWIKLSKTVHQRTFNCRPSKNCTTHQLVYQPYLNYNHYRLVTIFTNQYLVYDHTLGIRLFDAITKITFYLILCFFWLIITDSYRIEQRKRKYKRYYFPRFFPLFLIWVIRIMLYLKVWNNQMKDPQTEEDNDIPGFKGVEIAIFVLELVYVLWIFSSYLMTIVYILKKKYNSTNEEEKYFSNQATKNFFYFFILTLIVYIIIILFYLDLIVPKFQSNSFNITFVYVSINLYIYYLTMGYTPCVSLSHMSNEKKIIERLEKYGETEKLNEGSDIDNIDLNTDEIILNGENFQTPLESDQNNENETNSELELLEKDLSRSNSRNNSETVENN